MQNPIVTALLKINNVQARLEVMSGVGMPPEMCKKLAADLEAARTALSHAITTAVDALGGTMR